MALFGNKDKGNPARDGSTYGKAVVDILRPALDQQDARRTAAKRAADKRDNDAAEWAALHEYEED